MTTEAPETPSSNGRQELKVVLTIRGEIATIGVQRPLCDPFLVSFPGDAATLENLVGHLPGVVARAVARWGETPLYPKYDRPAPPPAAPRPARTTQGRPAAPQQTTQREAEQTLRLF